MLENRFLRNKDLINQKLLNEITVIGLGGIGSTVVTLLAIMGWDKIIGWDNDTLEAHNLSSTTYPTSYVGVSKLLAASHIVSDYSHGKTKFVEGERNWDSSKPLGIKVITCLDNMDTRLEAYEAWRQIVHDSNAHTMVCQNAFFIDLRMSALSLEMITITCRTGGFLQNSEEIYEKHWVPDSQIEPAPCTMKHTIFASSIIGGLGVNQVFNCVANKPYYSYIWTGLLPLNLEKDNLVKPITME
jgi:hypothetical protein